MSHPNKCRVTLSINAMFYVGPEADKKIYLYMLDNHFDLILKDMIVSYDFVRYKNFIKENVDFKFVDSIHFIPTAFIYLPNMFGLPELAKGCLIHLLNTTESKSV